MRTLILNSTDILPNTGNATLSYEFAGGNINLKKGQKIALASLQMYNSTFNITAANQNNFFKYTWVDGNVFDVTIPDGYYDINTLNNYLHFVMVQSYHYMVTSTGDFVYFLTLGINPVKYAVELNAFGISVAIAAANVWVLPAGATWVLPIALIVPRLTLSSAPNNFRFIIGFASASFPNNTIGGIPPNQTQGGSLLSANTYTSTLVPQVSVVSSYIMTCSLINNNYAVPNSLIYSFAPQGTIGEQFTVAPNQYVFIDVLEGQYSRFTVSFIDQNFKPVIFQDPNMIIQLVISEIGDELGL